MRVLTGLSWFDFGQRGAALPKSCDLLVPRRDPTHSGKDQSERKNARDTARTRSRASNFCPVSTARCFSRSHIWVGSRKVDWCWSFSSKDVIETSLTTTISPRTSVEPELIYLLSPSHLSSFTDAGMDKETSSATTLLMEKREGWREIWWKNGQRERSLGFSPAEDECMLD